MKKIFFVLLILIANFSIAQDQVLWDYMINQKGEEVDLGLNYTERTAFEAYNDGFAVVRVQKKVMDKDDPSTLRGIIDKNAKWVFKPTTDIEYIRLNNGFALIKSKFGTKILFDLINNKELRKTDGFTKGFSEDLCTVCENKSCETIDKKGKIIFKIQADEVYEFSNGLAAVHKNDRAVGYIDKTGKMQISFDHNYAWSFSKDGYAFYETKEQDSEAKKKENVIGIIDKTGAEILPPSFTSFYRNAENLIEAYNRKSGYLGFFNSKGEKLFKTDFYHDGDFVSGYQKIKKKSKFGVIDATGKIIFKPIYDAVELGTENEIFFLYDEAKGFGQFCDKSGNPVISEKYLSLSGGFFGQYAFVSQRSIIDLDSFNFSENAIKELEKVKTFNDDINEDKKIMQQNIDSNQLSNAIQTGWQIQKKINNYIDKLKEYIFIPKKLLHYKIMQLKREDSKIQDIITKIKS